MNGACMFPHGDGFVAQGMFHTNGRGTRGPTFISWAVSSYQSNGAGCDFSQGISVCLIEILYPIQVGSFVASPPSPPSFSFVLPLSFLSSFLFSLSLSPYFLRSRDKGWIGI